MTDIEWNTVELINTFVAESNNQVSFYQNRFIVFLYFKYFRTLCTIGKFYLILKFDAKVVKKRIPVGPLKHKLLFIKFIYMFFMFVLC